jgi:CubicO group peptidase (beta-lactamase class C family)
MIKHIFAGIGALSLVGTSLLNATEPMTIDSVIQQRLEKIDPLMNKLLETSQIPGMSVGVVVDGKIVFTKGYGMRNVSETVPVTENSLFAIGSCSKAFTTFALGGCLIER